ncbi:MAG: disulfide bond formation protein B [Alphaproteobacteria bacterium]|jgi:disulfide bond formation protein DsbB|nr:disulfide bond formation protein B [Alphaproteobacteria bacterium]
MLALLDRPATSPFLILAASAGALGAAFIAQYGFGLEPCVLCIYQRWPFAIVIVVAAAALLLVRGGRSPAWALALAGLVFAANAAIAGYHVGVEQHWWQGTAECTGTSGAATLAELKAQILAAPLVRCDEVAWSLFGVSMAGYNVLASAALAAFSLAMAKRLNRPGEKP